MEDQAQGQRWPPLVDWRLADASEWNRDAPRRFLEEDAWKLFLTDRPPTLRKSHWKTEIVLGVRWFSAMEDCVRQHGESVLKYHLKETQRRFFATMLRGVSGEIEFRFDVEPDLNTEQDPDLGPRLGAVIRGRRIREWIELYLHGRSFALALGAETVNRFVFIEELFGAPVWYHRARASMTTTLENVPLVISGVPRAGKTYSALRLLYDVHSRCLGSVCFFDNPGAFQTFVERLQGQSEPAGRKIFCVLDDPFGGEECDELLALTVKQAIERLQDRPLPLQLVITSRREVLEEARRIGGQVLCEPNVVEFTFDAGEAITKHGIYPSDQLENILEKAAWLLGANWLARYELYRKMKSSAVAPLRAEHDAWQRVLEADSVPGVIWSALLMNPEIASYQGDDITEIRRIGERVASAKDLRLAFDSGLLTWLSAPENEANAAKVLYLLLPSITVVYPDLVPLIFDAHEQESIRSVERSFVRLRESIGAYSIVSIQYFHPTLAHAVQDLVKERGRALYEALLLPYMVGKANLPPAIVADFLCSYFSLGCPANALTGELFDRLFRGQSPLEKQWVSVVAAFFVESSGPAEELSDALRTADPEVLSRFSVLLDELLSADVDTGFNEEKVRLLLRTFFKRIFTNDLGTRPVEFTLRGSLILHGVLGHLEDYLSGSLMQGKEANLDEAVDVVREMSGSDELMNLISSEEDPQVLIQAATVWIDALLMKIGELQYYLTIQVDMEPEGNADDDNEGRKRALLQALVLRMTSVVEELWELTLTKSEDAPWHDYLAGAMAFSVAWHNRWGVSGATDDPITDWVGAGGFLTGDAQGDSFWEGVKFNLLYHSRYFQVRASAWHRETALRLWRRGRPRLGADSSHEAGLDSSEQDAAWGRRFSGFYRACITRLLPLELNSTPLTSSEVAGITFVLGLRAPREDELAEEFESRIEAMAGTRSWTIREGFWDGVLRLYVQNIRDSIDFTQPFLLEAFTKARRGQPESLTRLAEMASVTTQRLLSTSGEPWVAQSLDRIRPLIQALTEL